VYVYGKNVVKEIIKKKGKMLEILLSDKFSDEKILSDIQKLNIRIIYLNKKEISRFASYNHQGIIASVPDYEYANIDEIINDDNNFILILDHLEDPHNFGAIIRTAEAAGVSGIVIPKDRSVSVNSTVMKISSGALNNVKVSRVVNINNLIKELKEKGFWIVGTDVNGSAYDEIDMKGKIAIIIGNEGKGMASLVKKSCDYISTIPINGKIQSLNASVAAGILIYEVIRQRK